MKECIGKTKHNSSSLQRAKPAHLNSWANSIIKTARETQNNAGVDRTLGKVKVIVK